MTCLIAVCCSSTTHNTGLGMSFSFLHVRQQYMHLLVVGRNGLARESDLPFCLPLVSHLVTYYYSSRQSNRYVNVNANCYLLLLVVVEMSTLAVDKNSFDLT